MAPLSARTTRFVSLSMCILHARAETGTPCPKRRPHAMRGRQRRAPSISCSSTLRRRSAEGLCRHPRGASTACEGFRLQGLINNFLTAFVLTSAPTPLHLQRSKENVHGTTNSPPSHDKPKGIPEAGNARRRRYRRRSCVQKGPRLGAATEGAGSSRNGRGN